MASSASPARKMGVVCLMEGVAGEADLLSALPDSLLLHILSFLHMKDVVRTAHLSRRWRRLWTSTPLLDFSWRVCERTWLSNYTSPAFIDRALALHGGTKVESFCAAFPAPEEGKEAENEELVRKVDSWVCYAVRYGVKELEIDCSDLGFPFPFCVPVAYPLLHGHPLFTCQSLASLTLQFCHLDPPPRFLMSSLKVLTLCQVKIDACNLKYMLAGCPFLECLTLEDCNLSSVLIHVGSANSRLKTLKICEVELVDEYWLHLSAPSITTLVLEGYLRTHYQMGLSSVVAASLDFRRMWFRKTEFALHDCLADLLCKLRCVQVLKLCSWCTQALSMRASESSQFAFNCSIISLELLVGFMTCEFPGIFYALRSFIKLELLTVNIICQDQITSFWDEEDYAHETKYVMSGDYAHEPKYVMPNESCSPSMLQHLKTVRIFGLVGAICAEEENKTAKEVHGKYQNGVNFIRILLKNSPVLERLMISVPVKANKLTNENLKVLFTFVSRLLALPRASPNAQVIIQDK